MPTDSWRPSASLDQIRRNAQVRDVIRQWMKEHRVLEIATPLLSASAPGDVHLDSFCVETAGGRRYLQTSPEYPMKRFLAAHPVDCYQIAPVFRAGERGHRHNPEFTMLEWYRVGLDHVALMVDVESLLQTLWQAGGRSWPGVERIDCGDLVDAVLGAGSAACRADRPFVECARVREFFRGKGRSFPESIGDDADAAFDLLMDTFVLPGLAAETITFVTGWPPSQAALARLGRDDTGRDVAERFELYIGSSEVGNGYHELADPVEQRERFEAAALQRQARRLAAMPLDENLLDALAAGLPNCAGIAVGLERLCMALDGLNRIDDVIAFPFARA